MAILMALAALLVSAPVSAQSLSQGQAVVTVLPKVDRQLPSSVTQQDLAVKVNGKNAKVTHWAPFQAPENKIELVLLIDGAARNSLGRQMGDIAAFIQSLPPNVKAAIAYMANGQAIFVAPLTTDHEMILRNLHLPGGIPGIEASPYFCLSNLAKNWPGQDPEARREVVMVTDGVDNYERQYDPNDPYVEAAIEDATRARLVVYAIYWMNQGRADQTENANDAGQNLLMQVTQATGGKSFWQGMGNPVSFQSYFEELNRRFRNQYELSFTGPVNGKPDVEEMKLKLHAPGTEIDAPQRVYMVPGAPVPN
ncbi:MAG TPA: hypothetical protein VGT08_06690 [Terracidiphilus sp.]|nr:hypothetical protein [Terracidiphilus sp.]